MPDNSGVHLQMLLSRDEVTDVVHCCWWVNVSQRVDMVDVNIWRRVDMSICGLICWRAWWCGREAWPLCWCMSCGDLLVRLSIAMRSTSEICCDIWGVCCWLGFGIVTAGIIHKGWLGRLWLISEWSVSWWAWLWWVILGGSTEVCCDEGHVVSEEIGRWWWCHAMNLYIFGFPGVGW